MRTPRSELPQRARSSRELSKLRFFGPLWKLYLRLYEMRKLVQGILPCRGSVPITANRRASEMRDGWEVAHPLSYSMKKAWRIDDDSRSARGIGGSFVGLDKRGIPTLRVEELVRISVPKQTLFTHLRISRRQRVATERMPISSCIFALPGLRWVPPSRSKSRRPLRPEKARRPKYVGARLRAHGASQWRPFPAY